MTIDKRVGTKLPKFADKDRALGSGQRDPGPYIGIVKNNSDPIRAGRLQVYVSDFGGTETDQSHWITVSYASPYTGAARTPFIDRDPESRNEYKEVNHSYGMWMTPPDIGNHVLITFVNGDINRGYWFACIQPDLSHWATPGLAGATNVAPLKDPALQKALKTPPYPVVEFNDYNQAFVKDEFLTGNQKPIHEHQVRTLLDQGLEDDKVRGVISSSSQRESPSRVFGISTPGREGDEDPKANNNAIPWRQGGHTFVMDDGTMSATRGGMGKDQLIRLRTAGGHQLLMNDSEEILYIGNANGKTWLEFTREGKILMFAENDISVRSQRSINLHADKDINMFAGGNIKMFANTSIQKQSATISLKATTALKEYGGTVEQKAGSTFKMIAGNEMGLGSGTELVCSSGMIYLNTKAAPDIVTPADIPSVKHKEPLLDGLKWVKDKGSRETTIPLDTMNPSHEPYSSHSSYSAGTPPVQQGVLVTGDGTVVKDSQGNPVATQGNVTPPPPGVGPSSATGDGVKVKAGAAAVADQHAKFPGPQLGPMSSEETSALKAQLAQHESGNDYSKVGGSGGNYLGKYQSGSAVLVTQGYVSKEVWDATPVSQRGALVNDPANWTGQDGIKSKEDFLANQSIQEKVMDKNLTQNYNSLKSAGVVNAGSDPSVVSGNLAASHLKGAGATIQWNKGTLSNTKDGFGTDIGTYYNEGRYANTVLAKNYTASTTPAVPAQASRVVGGVSKPV